jgi:heme/copper-type cytochrome/quinol oxidase subunit 4
MRRQKNIRLTVSDEDADRIREILGDELKISEANMLRRSQRMWLIGLLVAVGLTALIVWMIMSGHVTTNWRDGLKSFN